MSCQFITARRVRRILSDATTDADAAAILRAHSVRHHYSTAGGTLHIVVPTVAGTMRIRLACDAFRAAAVSFDRGRPFSGPFRMPILHADD